MVVRSSLKFDSRKYAVAINQGLLFISFESYVGKDGIRVI